jgi:hypothetical protein
MLQLAGLDVGNEEASASCASRSLKNPDFLLHPLTAQDEVLRYQWLGPHGKVVEPWAKALSLTRYCGFSAAENTLNAKGA